MVPSDMLVSTHSWVPGSAHSRDTSCCSWELTWDPQLDDVQRTRDFGAHQPNWDVLNIPLPWTYLEGEMKRLQVPEVTDDLEGTVSFRLNRTEARVTSRRLGHHLQALHRFKPEGALALREGSGCAYNGFLQWTLTGYINISGLASAQGFLVFSLFILIFICVVLWHDWGMVEEGFVSCLSFCFYRKRKRT